MSNSVDRESFTLLNLTESGSDSIPDLDLVQPTRKPNKRKVKHKRRVRGNKPSHNSDLTSEFSPLKVCQCGTFLSPNRVGGAVFILGCLGSLFYLTFTLTGRIHYLENKLNNVDDVSKGLPASILKIKNCIEELQSNETELNTKLKNLDKRLVELEKSVSSLYSKPREKDIQQNLADFGGKLTEVKQTVDVLRNNSKIVFFNMEKITQEINDLKLGAINSTEKQNFPDSTEVLDLKSMWKLQEEKLLQEENSLANINKTVSGIAKNSNARLDLFNSDLNSLQGKMSRLEDDNKNISSQLLSLDRTLNTALTEVNVKLSSLTTNIQHQMLEEQQREQLQQMPPNQPMSDGKTSAVVEPKSRVQRPRDRKRFVDPDVAD